MFRLKTLRLLCSKAELERMPEGKLMIATINAYSHSVAWRNGAFADALLGADVLLPDGMSIVKACRWLGAVSQPQERIAGWDLFVFEMERLNRRGGRCLFVGSTGETLRRIKERAAVCYPNVEVETFSPPFRRHAFDDEDTGRMLDVVNGTDADLIWIGMTAPKQELWVYRNWNRMDVSCHVGMIGAVFDFFAGTAKRAPVAWQENGLEWLYRLLHNPRRLWRRYIIGNSRFLWAVAVEYIADLNSRKTGLSGREACRDDSQGA